MPTGFTARLIKENQNFNEFVWSCARHFGGLFHLRDEKDDSKIFLLKDNQYHQNEVNKLKKELEIFEKSSDQKIQKLLDDERKKAKANNSLDRKKCNKLRKCYEKMLSQVIQWNPPSSDHENLKMFMINQLKESIEFDCNISYYKLGRKPRYSTYKKRKIERISEEISYHECKILEDRQRFENINNWIIDLSKSVEIPEKLKGF